MSIGDIRFDNGCSCENCTCGKNKQNHQQGDYIYDESGFIVGAAAPIDPVIGNFAEYFITDPVVDGKISYKYAEDKILADLKAHLDKTYSEHYMTENNAIECFDAWIALGDSTPTFRNTAIKYLWRYGKKNGNNKKDLMKALHYIFMCLYVDHYRKDEK